MGNIQNQQLPGTLWRSENPPSGIQTWLEKPPFIDLILPVETPFSSDIWQLATFDATRGTIVDGQIMLNPYYINPY